MQRLKCLSIWQKVGLLLAYTVATGLLSSAVAHAAPPTTVTVQVPANQESPIDTGLSVISGGKVTISTTGTATYGPEGQRNCSGVPVTTPDGYRSVNGLPCGLKIDPHSTLPPAPIGAALASVGVPGDTCSTGWFDTGSYSSSTYSASGELYLLYNDSVGQYSNNTGSYAATVTVTEPAHHSPTCNKIVDVQLHQTPQTPLYDLSLVVTLNTANISCPGTVKVSSAGISATAAACQNGVPQGKIVVQFPVFEGKTKQLAPGKPSTFDVTVSDTKGKDHLKKSINVPPVPVWVGLGDSTSSGHNQLLSLPCKVTDAGNTNGQCGLFSNVPQFSWVTRATNQLNSDLHVPDNWKMKTDFLAHSGNSTSTVASTQAPQMISDLTQGKNSWNIVSVSGGADDVDFAAPLVAFYEQHFISNLGMVPWAVPDGDRQDCPDTSDLFNRAQADVGVITGNLEYVLGSARSVDPNSRLIDLNYPYVVPTNNVCSPTVLNSDSTLNYGAQAVVDEIDDAHLTAAGSQAGTQLIDLRQVFGSDPLNYLQLVYFYGYPHANNNGQATIAGIAAQDAENTQ